MIDDYDAALFDLDGVVYLGPDPVPGAAEGIGALRAREVRVGFVTNNAARGPAEVAAHLTRLGIHAQAADVVTSAQAGARVLADRFPDRGSVLVVGTDALIAEVRAYGFTITRTARDRPVAVIQGYDPDVAWPLLDEAGFALQAGAAWIATNTDPTRPTDRGLVPGNGACLDVVRSVSPIPPVVAGKPYRPLMDETTRRLAARSPIFVGDRTDTDIAGAFACGMDSLLVFTGAHGPVDLLAAPPEGRPTQVGADLRALLEPARRIEHVDDTVSCGTARARLVDDAIEVNGTGLDALWACANLAWSAADRGVRLDLDAVAASCAVR